MDKIDDILKELKRELQKIYKRRLRQVILYGSYARGEATKDSDIDVAVILSDFHSVFEEINHTGELVAKLSLKYDTLITLLPIREKDFIKKKAFVYVNVEKEGIPI